MRMDPITTEQNYLATLKKLELVFDAAADTKEGEEANELSLLIEAYEDKRFPIESPTPNNAS